MVIYSRHKCIVAEVTNPIADITVTTAISRFVCLLISYHIQKCFSNLVTCFVGKKMTFYLNALQGVADTVPTVQGVADTVPTASKSTAATIESSTHLPYRRTDTRSPSCSFTHNNWCFSIRSLPCLCFQSVPLSSLFTVARLSESLHCFAHLTYINV